MRTSKSPRMVLVFAYLTAKFALPRYAHRCSPKTYTQWQFFACLVLKEFLKLDYRKLAALLTDAPELRKAIELTKVPHFTTFQKAAQRLLRTAPARRLLDTTIHVGVAVHSVKRRIELAALDGTGFESHHASSYYVRRREKGGEFARKSHSLTYRRFPKAGILCDCASHMILAVVPGRGPAPDVPHFRAALDQARRRAHVLTLAADAGYDSEASHEYARNTCGVRTLIPPLIGRPTEKLPSGYWRRQMKIRLHTTRYTQRWQVETVNSMIKRLLDSALRARNYWSQCRELVLRAITHNVMIIRRLKVFYRAGPTDMRKSFSGLVGLVEKELGQQVESGHLFLFFNRRRDRVKVLYFVGDGLVIFYRYLEQGTFELPRRLTSSTDDAPPSVEIRQQDLALILEGIELSSVRRRKRWHREPEPV